MCRGITEFTERQLLALNPTRKCQVILFKGPAKGMLVMMMNTSSVDGLVLAPLPVLATTITRDKHCHWLISALHLTQVVSDVAHAAAVAFKRIRGHRDLTKRVAVQLFCLGCLLQHGSQIQEMKAYENSADADHYVCISLNSCNALVFVAIFWITCLQAAWLEFFGEARHLATNPRQHCVHPGHLAV